MTSAASRGLWPLSDATEKNTPPARANLCDPLECAHLPCDWLQSGFIVKRIFSATINSLRAIAYGFRNEAALREEMIALVAALVAAFFIAPTLA